MYHGFNSVDITRIHEFVFYLSRTATLTAEERLVLLYPVKNIRQIDEIIIPAHWEIYDYWNRGLAARWPGLPEAAVTVTI